MHNEYPLTSDEIEVKEKMTKYQVMIADFHDIPIDNVKKLMRNGCDKEKYVLLYQNVQL